MESAQYLGQSYNDNDNNNNNNLKESEKKDKYLDLAWELKKTMEHKGDDYTNRDWCFWYCN